MDEKDKKFMQQAIDLSIENVKNGGGPFGAVIVRGDEVIATGVNNVVPHCDPTAHAEVSAKELPECSVSADEEWISILVDEDRVTVMEVLGALQKTHSIRDMQLQEISTEEVIKKIYEEGVQ